jgi:translation initiation factor 3 subunit G
MLRVYLPKHEGGYAKGYAFVTFADREDAERAMQSLNGYGYDNLILRVEWAK